MGTVGFTKFSSEAESSNVATLEREEVSEELAEVSTFELDNNLLVSKLTFQLTNKIIHYFSKGMGVGDVCDMLSLNRATLRNWINKGGEDIAKLQRYIDNGKEVTSKDVSVYANLVVSIRKAQLTIKDLAFDCLTANLEDGNLEAARMVLSRKSTNDKGDGNATGEGVDLSDETADTGGGAKIEINIKAPETVKDAEGWAASVEQVTSKSGDLEILSSDED